MVVKKKPPKKGKSDKDARKRQEKRLLAWHDEGEEKAVRKKAMGVVVIKGMFDPKEFDEDATYLTEIRDDLQSECGKLGVVKKVMIFDRHPEVSAARVDRRRIPTVSSFPCCPVGCGPGQ